MIALNERLENIREEVMEIHYLAKRSVEVCLYGLEGDEDAKRKVIQIEQIVDSMNTTTDCECISCQRDIQLFCKDEG